MLQFETATLVNGLTHVVHWADSLCLCSCSCHVSVLNENKLFANCFPIVPIQFYRPECLNGVLRCIEYSGIVLATTISYGIFN